MTGLGVKPKTLKKVLEKPEPKKRGRKKKGEGIGALAKLAAKALTPIAMMLLLTLPKIKFLEWVKKKRGRKPGKVTTGQLLGIAKQLRKMGRKKLEPMLYNVGPVKSH
jgi:hypothetical protein